MGAFFFLFLSLWSGSPVILFGKRHRSGLFGGVAAASPPFLARGPRPGWCLFLLLFLSPECPTVLAAGSPATREATTCRSFGTHGPVR